MINIYDSNNYVRRKIETDFTGNLPRVMLNEYLNPCGAQVFVWDGDNGNAKRRQVFPDYKRRDTPTSKEIYANFKLIQDVLSHTTALQVIVPGYEADDVIATLARHYAALGEIVAIHSTDLDYMQLCGEFPGQVFCGAKVKDHVEAEDIRYYKTMVGDTSDRISGCKGFGDGTWTDLDKADIRKFVDAIVERGEIIALPNLPKRCKPDAIQLKIFWDIIGFYDVPMSLISDHIIIGKPNYAAADAFLKEFMN